MTLFEELGVEYKEVDGILYPLLSVDEAEYNLTDIGKYGRISAELNGSRKGHMRSILMFIILRRKSVKRKYRHWNRKKNISLLRMKD